MLPETSAGGLHVPYILDRIRHLVRQALDAVHIITVNGYLSEADINAIKGQGKTLLRRRGQLHVLANPMLPEAVGNAAQFYVTDFVAARQVPQPLAVLFQVDEFEASNTGLTAKELLDLTASLPQMESEAAEIHAALNHIRATRG